MELEGVIWEINTPIPLISFPLISDWYFSLAEQSGKGVDW